MPFIGGYPAVTDLTGPETVNVVVGGVLKEITAANMGTSTVIAEAIRDIIGTALVAGSGVTLTVNDVSNTITIAATGATWDAEQTRDTMATALVAGANMSISVNDAGDQITLTAGTGATWDAEQTRDTVAAALVGELNYVVVTPDDTGDTITISLDPAFKALVETIGPGTRIQTNDALSLTAASVSLPGTSGSYVSTPDAAPLDLTGDIDLAVRVSLADWTPTADVALVSKWVTTSNQRSWVFLVKATTGFLSFSSSADGATVGGTLTSTTAPTVADGAAIWLRVTREAAGTNNTDFYTAPDSAVVPTVWTALTLNRTTTGSTIFNSTAPLAVGAQASGTASMMTGNAYRAILKNGIAGTTVADFDPSMWTTGSTFTSGGAVWTLQGSASISATVGAGTSNTTAEFSLAETDANAAVGIEYHDTIMFFTNFALINTSGSAANFTFSVKVNGATLFSLPVQSLTSVAASVRTGAFALRLDMSGSTGADVAASMEFNIANAVTGTAAGSATAATDLVRLTANLTTTALGAFTTLPVIQLRCTMGTAASTISAQRGFTQVFVARA